LSAGRAGPIVTVDGPAGSGKSTTAREAARRLGFRHLDSGALYRALTLALLDSATPPDAWPQLTREEIDALNVAVTPTPSGFDVSVAGRVLGPELRADTVTAHVSQLSRVPAVRAALLGLQRSAGSEGNLVADGRDMGTVVFPDAEVKIFLVADIHERARRRLLERGVARPSAKEMQEEAAAIALRDERDSSRSASPLRRPEGAVVVDTTHLTVQEQVEVVVREVRGSGS
jgi:cytidylate kinase